MLSQINRISYTAICTLITTNTPVIHSFNLLPYGPSNHTFILNLHNTMCNPHQNTRNSLMKVFGPNIDADKFSLHPSSWFYNLSIILVCMFSYSKRYLLILFEKYLYPFPISPTSDMPLGTSSFCI